MAELILGGARSGKSALAERRALEHARPVTYVATGQAGDPEMATRIAVHRARRPTHWRLVEEPLALAAVLQRHACTDACLIVDCLTLWLSNLVFAGRAAEQAEKGEAIDCPLLQKETDALIDVLPSLSGRTILVSNEVGMGIVPLGALSRLFSDEQGRLNQRVAAVCARVTLVAAGLPLELKNTSLLA